jgi:hypothetical protein
MPFKHLLTIAALAALALPVMAQGEGNGLDAALRGSAFPAPFSDLDQVVLATDPFIFEITSSSAFGNPILFFSDGPCGTPQPSLAFGGTPGVIGVDLSRAAVMFDAFSAPFPAIIGFDGTWQLPLILPDFIGFEDREDVFVQGAVFDPASGNPFGWMVTNTIRLETVQTGIFQDTFHHADCGPALGDADVGTTITVDTQRFNDGLTTNGPLPGSDVTSAFTLDPHPVFVLDGSKDVVTRFQTNTGGQFRFDLCGSSFDTTLAIAAFPSRTPLLFVDDPAANGCAGDPLAASLEICLQPGETIYLVIDGAGIAQEGLADLSITALGPCPPPAPGSGM